jgi:hypothetical protein
MTPSRGKIQGLAFAELALGGAVTVDMSVNYLAVFVAGIASGIIGFLYYGVPASVTAG